METVATGTGGSSWLMRVGVLAFIRACMHTDMYAHSNNIGTHAAATHSHGNSNNSYGRRQLVDVKPACNSTRAHA